MFTCLQNLSQFLNIGTKRQKFDLFLGYHSYLTESLLALSTLERTQTMKHALDKCWKGVDLTIATYFFSLSAYWALSGCGEERMWALAGVFTDPCTHRAENFIYALSSMPKLSQPTLPHKHPSLVSRPMEMYPSGIFSSGWGRACISPIDELRAFV